MDPDTGQVPESEEFDYKHAYENELRPKFTQTTQELAETRESLSAYEQLFEQARSSDPEAQAAALEALGLELDTGSQAAPVQEQVEDFVDPLEEELGKVRSELDELKQARELEAEASRSQELLELRDQYITQELDKVESELAEVYGADFKLTPSEERAIGNLAIAEAAENEVPDVKAAYELLFNEVLETNRQRWVSTKRAGRPPSGSSIPSEAKPPTNNRERAALINQRIADQG